MLVGIVTILGASSSHSQDADHPTPATFSGTVKITRPLTASGMILTPEDEQGVKGTVLDVPLINVQPIVLLHHAFKKVYPFCFEETLMLGASD